MLIHIFSDIQGVRLVFPESKADIVFVLGDIYWEDLFKIDKHYDVPIVGVLGNHDRYDFFGGTKIINVHEKVVEICGLKISGYEGSPKYNWKPGSPQHEDGDISFYINKKMGEVDLFLAHSNPKKGYEDRDYSHRGFSGLDDLFNKKLTKYLFHGHVHENKEYEINNVKGIVTYGCREFELKKPF